MENKLIDDCMKRGFGMMRLPRVEGTGSDSARWWHEYGMEVIKSDKR